MQLNTAPIRLRQLKAMFPQGLAALGSIKAGRHELQTVNPVSQRSAFRDLLICTLINVDSA